MPAPHSRRLRNPRRTQWMSQRTYSPPIDTEHPPAPSPSTPTHPPVHPPDDASCDGPRRSSRKRKPTERVHEMDTPTRRRLFPLYEPLGIDTYMAPNIPETPLSPAAGCASPSPLLPFEQPSMSQSPLADSAIPLLRPADEHPLPVQAPSATPADSTQKAPTDPRDKSPSRSSRPPTARRRSHHKRSASSALAPPLSSTKRPRAAPQTPRDLHPGDPVAWPLSPEQQSGLPFDRG